MMFSPSTPIETCMFTSAGDPKHRTGVWEGLQHLAGEIKDGWVVWWESVWPCGSLLGSALLWGAGRHLLQKECRQGSSLGSLLWKLSLQIGQVSIRPMEPGCFSLSSSAGKLSASFSTIITISSLSTISSSMFARLLLYPTDQWDYKQRTGWRLPPYFTFDINNLNNITNISTF